MHAVALRRTHFLLYAGIQFLVLTTCAMVAYAGGTAFDATANRYQFFDNFLSDLGSTTTFAGRTNYLSSALFAIALVTLGLAIVAFAGTWRAFAFARGRARGVGIASQVLGTASGVAFAGIALTPWNLLLTPHFVFVFAAFGLLLAYVACTTFLLWRNDGGWPLICASLAYIAVLCAYSALGVAGPGLDSEYGRSVQVAGQKIVAYASMVYLISLALALRRTVAARRYAGAVSSAP